MRLLPLLIPLLLAAQSPQPGKPGLMVRAANAAGDTVWVRASYQLPGNFPTTDSIRVDYYRPSTLLAVTRKTRAGRDSVKLASLVAEGGTQTFRVCTTTFRGTQNANTKCSATVSWTRPTTTPPPPPPPPPPDTTGTPTVGVDTLPDTVATTPPSDTVGALAVKADSFWHSVGANTHVTYVGGSPYDGLATTYKQGVKDSWIRHFRDNALVFDNAGWMHAAYDKAAILYNEFGVRFTLVANTSTPDVGPFTDASHLAGLFQYLPHGAVEAWEGFNERDISGRSNWVAETRQWQQTLYAWANANPTYDRPVLGPSVTSCGAASAIGDVSPWFDYMNQHPYPGDNPPQWAVDFNVPCNAPMNAQRKPIMATETGYQTNFAVTYHPPVSEAADAKYVPRMYLVNFNAGWTRSFDYELIDHSPQGFGFIRPDGTWKPSLTALSRLLKLVADSGAAYTPGRLSYTLTGDQTNVRRTLLQKRDGRFYLILWQEVKSFDGATDQMITVAPRAMTVTFPVARTVTVWRPNASATPIQSPGSVTSLAVSVPDEVLVLEIR